MNLHTTRQAVVSGLFVLLAALVAGSVARTPAAGDEKKEPKPQQHEQKPPLSELLAPGAIWSGNFQNTGTESAGTATLTITERDGTKVRGKLVTRYNDRPKDTPPTAWKVEGRIDGTRFDFDANGPNDTKAVVTLSLKEESLKGTFVTGSGAKGEMSLKVSARRGPDSRVTKITFPAEDVVLSYGERAPVFVVGLTTASAALEAPRVYIGDGEVALQLRADESKGIFFQGDIPLKSGHKFEKGSTVEVRPGFKWAKDLKPGDVYVILPGVKFVRPKE